MNTQPTLPLQRDHDLPPQWDGHTVTWSGWAPATPATTWDLHHRNHAAQCEACGSTAPQPTNRGIVRTPSLQVMDPENPHERPSHLIGSLIATRCPGCLLDTVVDLTTPDAEVWILDESDYHDSGSHRPQENR